MRFQTHMPESPTVPFANLAFGDWFFVDGESDDLYQRMEPDGNRSNAVWLNAGCDQCMYREFAVVADVRRVRPVTPLELEYC